MNDSKKTFMAGSHDIEQNTYQMFQGYLFIKIIYVFTIFRIFLFTLGCFSSQTRVINNVKAFFFA